MQKLSAVAHGLSVWTELERTKVMHTTLGEGNQEMRVNSSDKKKALQFGSYHL
jgi:hypothetical protein